MAGDDFMETEGGACFNPALILSLEDVQGGASLLNFTCKILKTHAAIWTYFNILQWYCDSSACSFPLFCMHHVSALHCVWMNSEDPIFSLKWFHDISPEYLILYGALCSLFFQNIMPSGFPICWFENSVFYVIPFTINSFMYSWKNMPVFAWISTIEHSL